MPLAVCIKMWAARTSDIFAAPPSKDAGIWAAVGPEDVNPGLTLEDIMGPFPPNKNASISADLAVRRLSGEKWP
eukprot:3231224-Heterocapsa_arctica.AAC.1